MKKLGHPNCACSCKSSSGGTICPVSGTPSYSGTIIFSSPPPDQNGCINTGIIRSSFCDFDIEVQNCIYDKQIGFTLQNVEPQVSPVFLAPPEEYYKKGTLWSQFQSIAADSSQQLATPPPFCIEEPRLDFQHAFTCWVNCIGAKLQFGYFVEHWYHTDFFGNNMNFGYSGTTFMNKTPTGYTSTFQGYAFCGNGGGLTTATVNITVP